MSPTSSALAHHALNEIENHETIIIHRSLNPSVDAYGSQLGLKEILEVNYPEKKVYAVGDNVNYLNTIGRMSELAPEVYAEALVLILGVSNHLMIDGEDWHLGKKIIEISHQPKKNDTEHLHLILPNYATCSELVGVLTLAWKLKINERAAKTLMFGLVSATSWFQLPNLTPNTFIVFAKLAEIFQNIEEIFETLRFVNPGDLALKHYINKHTKVTHNLVTWIFISHAKQARWDLETHRVGSLMSHVMDLAPGEFSVMFVERPDKKINLILRSQTRPAHLMAEKYDGWGTPCSAKAILKNKKMIKEVLKELENEVVV